jgi:hypothetical protein
MNHSKHNHGFIVPMLIFIVVFVSGVSFYFYQKAKSARKDPEGRARQDSARFIEEVGKIVALPQGEEPTIATITDPDKLKDQPFFANAKVGYKVLIYPVAKKAFLYDPKQKKLIEVAPLFLGDAKQ